MHTSNFLRLSRLVIASIISVLLLSSLCFATDFSANMVTKQGGQLVSGKLYVAGSKARQEIQGRGMSHIMIIRGDKNVTYLVDPKAKQYREMPGAMKSWSASMMDKMLTMGANKKPAGKQSVNGISCDKYVYTSKKKEPGTVTMWVSKSLDLAVKTEFKMPQGSMTMEYKSIKTGKQPSSLFEVPKGYKKAPAPTMGGGMRPVRPKK